MKNGTLKNVVFYFTAIQTPINKYESTDKQYKVTVAVDKATATAFSKEFPKKQAKMIPNDEFLEKYKVEEVAFPEQPIQYVYTFNRDELRKDGTPIPEENRPKVFFQDASNKIYDITQKFLVGNGSRGDLSYFVIETEKFGNHPKLSNILVRDLVKFERDSNNDNWASQAQEWDDSVDIDSTSSEALSEINKPVKKTSSGPIVDQELPF